jgi:hypothetical protein
MRNVAIIGDSNVNAWANLEQRGAFRRGECWSEITWGGEQYRVLSVAVNGATAHGINKPESQVGAARVFEAALGSIKDGRWDYVGIALGYVDCEFVLPIRCQARGVSGNEQIEHSVREVIDYACRALSQVEVERRILLAANLPLLSSEAMLQVVQREVGRRKALESAGADDALRQLTLPSLQQRTDNILHFNRLLRAGALRHGMQSLDLCPVILDPGTGLAHESFGWHAEDHHLDLRRLAPHWYQALHAMIEALGSAGTRSAATADLASA